MYPPSPLAGEGLGVREGFCKASPLTRSPSPARGEGSKTRPAPRAPGGGGETNTPQVLDVPALAIFPKIRPRAVRSSPLDGNYPSQGIVDAMTRSEVEPAKGETTMNALCKRGGW